MPVSSRSLKGKKEQCLVRPHLGLTLKLKSTTPICVVHASHVYHGSFAEVSGSSIVEALPILGVPVSI